MKNIIKCLCFILLFIGCGSPKPLENKIVGIWKSKDGSIIELKDNNSVKIINYPLNLSNSDFKGVINGNGTWKVYKDKSVSWWIIELSITTDRIIPHLQSNGIALDLLIARNGLLGNGEDITSLFFWIGDPDTDNRYEFKKK